MPETSQLVALVGLKPQGQAGQVGPTGFVSPVDQPRELCAQAVLW